MERIPAIVRLAASLSPVHLPQLKSVLDTLVPDLISIDVAYEIVLQSYLFFGYAQAIESAKALAQVRDEKKLAINSRDTNVNWRDRGEQLCRRIYAPNHDRLIENMAAVSPELAVWMVEEGYGKVLSRPGPSELEREIASIVFLATSGHPVQLFSHVRGAKNLGATSQLLVSLIDEPLLGSHQRGMILETISKVFAT